MSFTALLDHRGVIYRATESRDGYNDVVQSWSALDAPDGMNCRADLGWSGVLQDQGAGEFQNAKRRWFLHKSFDVAERDVLSVIDGPNAPVNLLIVGVTRATAPKALHHYEVNVEVWEGELEES